MEDIYDNLNENLKCIHNLMKDIKLNPIEEKKIFYGNIVLIKK